MLDRLVRKIRSFPGLIRALGTVPALVYAAQAVRVRFSRNLKPFIVLRSKRASYPLRCRPGTSDIDVFDQIFVAQTYRCLERIDRVFLIIDCGANVGYSSAWFLSQFPDAKLIAVEPDPGNFRVLAANLARFTGRYHAICGAVWSHPTSVVLSQTPYRDGREWSRQVRMPKPGETPWTMATDIQTLLNESGCDRISILKVDIEGAESIVFSSNYESWIGRVDNIVIELHDEECRSVFMKAISSQRFVLSRSGELTVCRNAAGYRPQEV